MVRNGEREAWRKGSPMGDMIEPMTTTATIAQERWEHTLAQSALADEVSRRGRFLDAVISGSVEKLGHLQQKQKCIHKRGCDRQRCQGH